MGQKITYSLLASIFPISSTKPSNAERRGADGVPLVLEEKDTSSELTLLILLHLGSWMVWAVVYIILMQVNPSFEDAMGKVEVSSGLDSTWTVCLGCPLAGILSIGLRLLYNEFEPWSVVSSERSCCSCCPPKLKSSYREIPMEQIMELAAEEIGEIPREEMSENLSGGDTREIPVDEMQNEEAVTAEVKEMFEYIKNKRTNL